ncbi:MAG: M15 family metallopeptidase [Clostridia bacterium]|nr:M15 family metallopeptidase [Clostridia bacterium]
MKKHSDLKYVIIILLILALAVFGTLELVNRKQSTLQEAPQTSASSASEPSASSQAPSASVSVSDTQTTETASASEPSAPSQVISSVAAERVTNPDTGRYIVEVTDDNWQLVVVSGTREFPESYEPNLDEIFDTGKYLDARVAPHYEEMYTAAKQDGIILTPYSAYRSYERQKNNYNHLTETYMADYHLSREDAAKKAATVILPPGTSEHNLGLCMDICNVYDSFVNQKEYTWLTENAYKYGFILRYPKGKEDVTGIVFEPWHWRYVGVEWAKQIRDSGLCLEEFLDQQGIAY